MKHRLKLKSKKEFLTAYPWWEERLESAVKDVEYKDKYYKKRNKVYKQKYVYLNLNCDECGEPIKVLEGNLYKDYFGDGKVRCYKCSCHKRVEGRSFEMTDSVKKALSIGWSDPEVKKRRFETAKKRGTFMRSNLELQIENRFGGEHFFDGYYEIDVYYPDLKLGIEVDDPSHVEVDNPGKYQKHKGYHRDKDSHFEEQGITILHVTFHHGDWEARVANFLDGCYMGPLIDLDDPTYGDIVY